MPDISYTSLNNFTANYYGECFSLLTLCLHLYAYIILQSGLACQVFFNDESDDKATFASQTFNLSKYHHARWRQSQVN